MKEESPQQETEDRTPNPGEPAAPEQDAPVRRTLEAIRERQRQRGHVPPTAQEVDVWIQQERESWGD